MRPISALQFVFFTAALNGSCAAQPAAEPFEPGVYKDARYGEVKYRLLKPLKIDPDALYPIVLYIHPVSAKGDQNTRQTALLAGWTDAAVREKHPCFVLAPQCRTEWQVTSDDWRNPNYQVRSEAPLGQRAFLAALDDVIRSNPIDRDRVYLTGVGMGGTAVLELLLREPGRYAAAAPVGGTTQMDRAAQLRHLPIWLFNSDKDAQISRKSAEALRAALQVDHPAFRFSEVRVEDSHSPAALSARSAQKAYNEEMLGWLLEQNRVKNDWQIPLQRLDASLAGQMATFSGEVRTIPQKEEDALTETKLRDGQLTLRDVDKRTAAKGYLLVIGEPGTRRELWITSAAMPIERFRTLKVKDQIRAKGYVRAEGEGARLWVEKPEWWEVTKAAPEPVKKDEEKPARR